MEKINPDKIEKAIKIYVKQMGLEKGFKQYRIRKTFKEIIGEAMTNHIKKITINERKLYVYIDSSIVRNALAMKKISIIEKINKKYGEYILEEIIIN